MSESLCREIGEDVDNTLITKKDETKASETLNKEGKKLPTEEGISPDIDENIDSDIETEWFRCVCYNLHTIVLIP